MRPRDIKPGQVVMHPTGTIGIIEELYPLLPYVRVKGTEDGWATASWCVNNLVLLEDPYA